MPLVLVGIAHVSDEAGLTQLESEIAHELAQGHSLNAIADRNNISANTVKTHARNVCRKLDVGNRQELLELIEGVTNVLLNNLGPYTDTCDPASQRITLSDADAEEQLQP